jgi:hypothetical protein
LGKNVTEKNHKVSKLNEERLRKSKEKKRGKYLDEDPRSGTPKLNNPLKMLTKLKSDPEILKDVITDDKKHYSELGDRRGSYYEARNNNKSLKMQKSNNIISKKKVKKKIKQDMVDFNLDSDDYHSQYTNNVNNAPKRNSYQSFGDPKQIDEQITMEEISKVQENESKNHKRYPTFGTKEMNSNKRLSDFQKKDQSISEIQKIINQNQKFKKMAEDSQMNKHELFQIFNSRVKEVKSINAAQRKERLVKHISTEIQQHPQNEVNPKKYKMEGVSPANINTPKQNKILYREDPIPSTPEQIYVKPKEKTPKLKSLDSRLKNVLSNDPPEIIQLMRLDNRGKIQLNPKALEYLSNLAQDIKVVSVIGPYRSGKSFLLNRLNGQQKGFHVGNSTNPCTQGVWLWGVNTGELLFISNLRFFRG